MTVASEYLKPDWTLQGKFLFYHFIEQYGDADQVELSIKAEVSRSTVNRWLKSDKEISSKNLTKAAYAIFANVEPVAEQSELVLEFQKAFRYLEQAYYLNTLPSKPSPMPKMANDFLVKLRLPAEEGQSLLRENSQDNNVPDGDLGTLNAAAGEDLEDAAVLSDSRLSSGKTMTARTEKPRDDKGKAVDKQKEIDHSPFESSKEVAPVRADSNGASWFGDASVVENKTLTPSKAISSGKSVENGETTSTINAVHHDGDNARRSKIKNWRKWSRRLSWIVGSCALSIGTIAFASFPAFEGTRVSLAERLSGIDIPAGVTIYHQFDEPDRSFIGDFAVQAGFLLLQQEAERGFPRAKYSLGMAQLLGINVEVDRDAGVDLLAQAHEQGYEPASQSYAFALQEGVGSVFDPVAALQIYESLAEKENSSSLNSIGTLYEKGFLKPYNPELALRYYEEASELGNAHATYNIGNLYHHGAYGHIEIDRERAKSSYKSALSAGIELARTSLASMHLEDGDIQIGLELVQKGLEQKQTRVMIWLARQLLSGEHLERDVDRAKQLLEEALSRGNGNAAFDLAELIEAYGKEEELQRVEKLLIQADEAGNSWTQAKLGFRAEHNDELLGRAGIAERHYQKASDLGEGRAAYRLAAMILDERLPVRPREDAIELLRRGVARGDAYAQWRYSLILLDKREEPTDSARGLEMLRTAGERGDYWVTNNVGAVFDGSQFGQGPLVEIDEAEAAHWYLQAYEREGYNWAACNYISNEIESDPTIPLSTYNEMLQSGIESGNRGCLSIIFDDPIRMATWGKTYPELVAVLDRYVDAGVYSAIERYHVLRNSVLAPDNATAIQPEDYIDLLRRAANGGSVKAMLELDDGFFVERDGDTRRSIEFEIPLDERIAWLRLAASKGSFGAISRLVPEEYSVDPDRSWFDDLIHKTKVTEDPYRQFLIGLVLDHGGDGVDRDLGECLSSGFLEPMAA